MKKIRFLFNLILQLQDTETTTGESEVKFQVSRDTLGAMLRSMAYIREQLSVVVSKHSLLFTYKPYLLLIKTLNCNFAFAGRSTDRTTREEATQVMLKGRSNHGNLF